MTTGEFPEAQITVKTARVVAYYAGWNFYHVILKEGGKLFTAIPGQLGTHSSGVRTGYVIPAGSTVIVGMVSSSKKTVSADPLLIILGVISPILGTQAENRTDYSDLLSGTGGCFDKLAYHIPFEKFDSFRVLQASMGTPGDAIPGENAMVTPLGVGWFVGLAMAYLRASDRCGIWMYRLDEHLRMAAKSLESQTLSKEVLECYDEGELSVIERVAFLPWEALGAFESGKPIGKESNQKFDPGSIPTQYPIIPVEVDQRSIFRLLDFKGYLGDLQHTFLSAPYKATGVDAYGKNDDKHVGLFRSTLGADGALVIQSAKGIHLEKYPFVTLPLEQKTYDDPTGDTPEDYKPSGVFGKGEAQTRKDYSPEDTPGSKGSLGLDFHGCYVSQASLQTLRAHKKDWKVQDESTAPLKAELKKGTYDPEGGYKLEPRKMWMPVGRKITIPIQKDRWEGVSYYNGRAAVDLWDDGSVTLECAWGAQVTMTGGNIILSCPGDIIMAPGRNLVGMAPQDIVMRAGNSVDVTATRRDVRLKAEKNLMVLGGNGGTGGVLIESRDNGGSYSYAVPGEDAKPQGLVLKSARGVVSVLSKDFSLYASASALLKSQEDFSIDGRGLHLDAAQSVTMTVGDSSPQRSLSDDSLVHYSFESTGATFGTKKEATLFINGPAYVNGELATSRASFIGGALTVNGGVIASGGVTTNVPPATTQNQRNGIFDGIFASTIRAANDLVKGVRKTFKTLLNTASSYFNGSSALSDTAVSLRTSENYGTTQESGFLFFEARWQQYAKASGAGKKWTEKVVESGSSKTYPWPGDEAWNSQSRYVVFTMTSFDIGAGNATDKSDPATSTKTSMKAGFITNSAEE